MRNEIISAIIGGLASGALCGIAISYVIKVSKETLEHHKRLKAKEILDLKSEVNRLEIEVQLAKCSKREAERDRMRLIEEVNRLREAFRLLRVNRRETEDNELVLEAVKKAMMDNHPDHSGDPNTSEKFIAYNKLYKEMRGK